MARGPRGRRSDAVSSADTNDIARSVIDGLLEPLPGPPLDPVSVVDDFGRPTIPLDGRVFNFGVVESPQLEVSRASVVPVQRLPSGVSVSEPRAAAFCVRRKQRREVLHAMRRVRGRGGSRKRDWRSEIKC